MATPSAFGNSERLKSVCYAVTEAVELSNSDGFQELVMSAGDNGSTGGRAVKAALRDVQLRALQPFRMGIAIGDIQQLAIRRAQLDIERPDRTFPERLGIPHGPGMNRSVICSALLLHQRVQIRFADRFERRFPRKHLIHSVPHYPAKDAAYELIIGPIMATRCKSFDVITETPGPPYPGYALIHLELR